MRLYISSMWLEKPVCQPTASSFLGAYPSHGAYIGKLWEPAFQTVQVSVLNPELIDEAAVGLLPMFSGMPVNHQARWISNKLNRAFHQNPFPQVQQSSSYLPCSLEWSVTFSQFCMNPDTVEKRCWVNRGICEVITIDELHQTDHSKLLSSLVWTLSEQHSSSLETVY